MGNRIFSILIFVVFLGLIVSPAVAAQGEMLCFKVRNSAPYGIMGTFVTDYYADPTGVRARHRSDFRFDAAESRDDQGNYTDRAEFCSYGPFLPGHKLELILRTMFPVFKCTTRVDAGEIVIKGVRKPEGGTETSATCF